MDCVRFDNTSQPKSSVPRSRASGADPEAIVYFSTVVRAAPPERGGELVKLDWRRKTVLGRAPIVATNPVPVDPNPRGSTRGGRGVLVDGDRVFVASYHSLHVFDRDLKAITQLSHPLLANVHELGWDGGRIWAASTDIDAAIKLDREMRTVESWWPREDVVLAKRFGLTPLEIEKEADNRCRFVGVGTTAPGHVHLNAVAMQDGRPLVLLNRFGCLVKLFPTEIMIDDPTLHGCHNVLVMADGAIVINDTEHRAVRIYSADGKPLRKIELAGFPVVREMLRRHRRARLRAWLVKHGRPDRLFHRLREGGVVALPIFVRGLCEMGAGRILAGISPAAILEIDPATGSLLDHFVYSDDVHVCVHGLACAN